MVLPLRSLADAIGELVEDHVGRRVDGVVLFRDRRDHDERDALARRRERACPRRNGPIHLPRLERLETQIAAPKRKQLQTVGLALVGRDVRARLHQPDLVLAGGRRHAEPDRHRLVLGPRRRRDREHRQLKRQYEQMDRLHSRPPNHRFSCCRRRDRRGRHDHPKCFRMEIFQMEETCQYGSRDGEARRAAPHCATTARGDGSKTLNLRWDVAAWLDNSGPKGSAKEPAENTPIGRDHVFDQHDPRPSNTNHAEGAGPPMNLGADQFSCDNSAAVGIRPCGVNLSTTPGRICDSCFINSSSGIPERWESVLMRSLPSAGPS